MTALILCPGPSLAQFEDEGYDLRLRIGVNRAATKIPCEVFCACDHQLVMRERRNIKGTPLLFTNSESARKIKTWPAKVETFESIAGPDGNPLPGTSFSAIAAVWYAVAKGATKIQVYGADLAGTQDFDGVEAGETRDDARWARERARWFLTADALKKRGIELNRGWAL